MLGWMNSMPELRVHQYSKLRPIEIEECLGQAARDPTHHTMDTKTIEDGVTLIQHATFSAQIREACGRFDSIWLYDVRFSFATDKTVDTHTLTRSYSQVRHTFMFQAHTTFAFLTLLLFCLSPPSHWWWSLRFIDCIPKSNEVAKIPRGVS